MNESAVLSKFRLDGKVAIVTGVGPAMGRDFALALAEAGADVCVAARSRKAIDDVAHEIEALGRRALPLTVDVTSSAEIDRMVDQTVAELGRLDVLCNHAGGGTPKRPLVELTDEDWDTAIRVNLHSVFYGTRAAARTMIAQGTGGSIVNTSSITSTGVVPGHLIGYSTAKAAVNHFTRYMAVELSPYGIRVNAVLPGTFDVHPPELDDFLRTSTPMQRWGRADEIAPAVLYLASEASSYVTGETIVVSGGAFVTR